MKKLVILFVLLLPVSAFGKAWPVKMWEDVKAHSSIDAGKGIAYGSLHDFVYGDTMLGLKAFLFHYRQFYLEAGVTQRVDGKNPVTYIFGLSVHLQPFLKPIKLPDEYTILRSLYLGPWVGYDLHVWRAGLQVHLPWRFE